MASSDSSTLAALMALLRPTRTTARRTESILAVSTVKALVVRGASAFARMVRFAYGPIVRRSTVVIKPAAATHVAPLVSRAARRVTPVAESDPAAPSDEDHHRLAGAFTASSAAPATPGRAATVAAMLSELAPSSTQLLPQAAGDDVAAGQGKAPASGGSLNLVPSCGSLLSFPQGGALPEHTTEEPFAANAAPRADGSRQGLTITASTGRTTAAPLHVMAPSTAADRPEHRAPSASSSAAITTLFTETAATAADSEIPSNYGHLVEYTELAVRGIQLTHFAAHVRLAACEASELEVVVCR